MDIKCHRCGEPWDLDTFHDVAEEQRITFDQAVRAFRRDGCVATEWTGQCEPMADRTRSMMIAELGDLLGDDVDGFAAMLEDFNL